MNDMAVRWEIEKLISSSCSLLDDEHFDEWVKLFVDGGVYTVTAFSTEIRKQMIWMHHDTEALSELFHVLPQHVTDKAGRRHLFSIVDIQSQNEKTVQVKTNFSIIRTDTSGRSSLYATGQYRDVHIEQNGRWFIQERAVHLDTRQLDVPSHIPL